jgi:DNA-binding protein HU-beta
LRFKKTWVTRIDGFWHNPGLPMTKTELQSALAETTQTDKRTAGVFLDTLSDIAYKEIKKNGEFVLPGFGKLVKQKRKARTGFNPKTQQKIKIPAKTVVKFRVAKAAKDGVLG